MFRETVSLFFYSMSRANSLYISIYIYIVDFLGGVREWGAGVPSCLPMAPPLLTMNARRSSIIKSLKKKLRIFKLM